MYIEPNSTIKILKGIPWDNTYQHTPRFSSRSAQTTYMNSKVKYTLSKNTYAREGRGYLKVEKNVEDLIGCNYMMFQNPKSDGTMGKVFYAFITATEYINPVTTEVRYEIDVMQTWFLDCKLGQCFIERSHSATDNVGDNIQSEDFNIGEYVVSESQNLYDGDWSICLAGSIEKTDADWETYKSETLGWAARLPSGIEFTVLPMNAQGLVEVQSALHKYASSGAILGLFVVPTQLFQANHVPNETSGYSGYYSKARAISFTPSRDKMFGGYGASVKNKKLFTYPYSFVEVDNHQGGKTQYKYEFTSEKNKVRFYLYCDTSTNPSIAAVPYKYKGLDLNVDECSYLTNFPFLPFCGDTYSEYLAMNRNSRDYAFDELEVNKMQQHMNGVFSGLSASSPVSLVQNAKAVMGTYANDINASIDYQKGVASIVAHEQDLVARPAISIGGKGATTLFTMECFNLLAKAMSIPYDRAKRIDDYFSVYGYSMRCIGTPNITSRPYWNYIKLANPNITPINNGVPADDVSAIVHILTNGITFWHNANNIGNYSLDNSV